MSLAPKHMSLSPRISEKSYALSSGNVYVFDVPIDANKLQIKEAVEQQFSVTVSDVRSQVRKGKTKRSSRRRLQPIDGKRAARKQAFVTLKAGDSLPFFEDLN